MVQVAAAGMAVDLNPPTPLDMGWMVLLESMNPWVDPWINPHTIQHTHVKTCYMVCGHPTIIPYACNINTQSTDWWPLGIYDADFDGGMETQTIKIVRKTFSSQCGNPTAAQYTGQSADTESILA
jgi:hypothetical protein